MGQEVLFLFLCLLMPRWEPRTVPGGVGPHTLIGVYWTSEDQWCFEGQRSMKAGGLWTLAKFDFLLFYLSMGQNWKSSCQQDPVDWRPERWTHFLPIQIVGRIQFLAVVGLKSPESCCLSLKAVSTFLESAHTLWLMVPFTMFKVTNSGWACITTRGLLFSFSQPC